MMYASLKNVESSDQVGILVLGETAFWFVIWIIIEAFIGDPIVDFARGFVSKTAHLFGALGLDMIQGAWRWSMSWVQDLRVIGTGDFKDWMRRAFYLWACTGLPMILYQGSKSGKT